MKEKKILIVEGGDEKHFVRHLCALVGIDVPVIVDKKGAQNLIKTIRAELSSSGREVIGFVLDANDDMPARWQEISDEFSREGINLPVSPDVDGTIVNCRNYVSNISLDRIGLWLMPDNNSIGELENFIMTMIPDDDREWRKAQNYINDILERNGKFSQNKIPKAMVSAWLATRKLPGLIGKALQAGDLEINGHLCQKFISWLNQMYSS